MSYTVLARKYRSQTFDEVVGQEPIALTLKNAIKTDKVAHAYLFTGTRGVGKTTMARIFAKALNCHAFDKPTTEPCCKCDSCTAVNTGDDIDVIEIDGATNNGVEQVRELRQNAIYRPARSRFKIYVIDEVHMLSVGAFNALLKILEEPPSHVKFIFATTEPNKVIATIQSRCQRFDFCNINATAIAGHLKFVLDREKIKYQEDLLLQLAKIANGSMRDGLSLLDRLISTGVEPLTAEMLVEYLGCPSSEKIYQLIDKIGDSDPAGTLAAIEDLICSGLGSGQIVEALIDNMRDLMVVKSAGAESELLISTAEQRQRICELAEKFDVAGLIYNITSLEKLRWTIRTSDSPRALLEATLLRFALSEHFLNVDTLLTQLQDGVVKKKSPKSTVSKAVAKAPKPTSDKEQTNLGQLRDLESIKNNWQDILKTVASELGNGTSSLLKAAVPSRFENGVLMLTFSASAHVSKRIFESNGRVKTIESLLNRDRPVPLRIELETAEEQRTSESASNEPKSVGAKQNQIVADPAVKTVIAGLGATITGIEETINDY